MATIKILRECVVAHQRRIPGESVEVDEYTARQLASAEPETFLWVDRPVAQFVDMKPVAPVGKDKARPRKRQRLDDMGVAEVTDGDESAG